MDIYMDTEKIFAVKELQRIIPFYQEFSKKYKSKGKDKHVKVMGNLIQTIDDGTDLSAIMAPIYYLFDNYKGSDTRYYGS